MGLGIEEGFGSDGDFGFGLGIGEGLGCRDILDERFGWEWMMDGQMIVRIVRLQYQLIQALVLGLAWKC